MAFIEWNESYSVGIKAMDDQHKKLIALLNQLHDAMKQGKGSSEISGILKGLSDYTVFHFSDEEKLLHNNNFPGLIVQQNRHKEFVKKLLEYQTEAETNSLSISLKIRDFLRDWLIEHISGEDKKYMKYLNDKGIH